MAASRATDTAAAISSKPAPDNVRGHAGTVLRPFPSAAEVPADRIPSAQESPASQIDARDSFAVTALADIIDRSLHAAGARFTAGLSPAALADAYLDWLTHLTYAPGKRLQLVDKATRKAVRFANYASRCAVAGHEAPCCIEPLPQDKRFAGESWHKWPYNLVHQAFLLHQHGGTMRPPAFAESPSSTRAWSSSHRGKYSTRSRHRTSS